MEYIIFLFLLVIFVSAIVISFLENKDILYYWYIHKEFSKIKDKIDKIEAKLDANKSYNILLVLTISFTLIGTILNSAVNLRNNNDKFYVYEQMNNAVISELSKNYSNNEYETKNSILNKYKDYLNENLKDKKNFLDRIYIKNAYDNFDAIKALEEYGGELKSLEANSLLQEIGVIVLLGITTVFDILFLMQSILSFEVYRLKILKKVIEEKEKNNHLSIENMDYKHKLLIEIYSEYQNDIPNLKIYGILANYKNRYNENINEYIYLETLKKLENENLILVTNNVQINCKADQEIILSQFGINYLEKLAGIDKYLKSENKILTINKLSQNKSIPSFREYAKKSIVAMVNSKSFQSIMHIIIFFILCRLFPLIIGSSYVAGVVIWYHIPPSSQVKTEKISENFL